MKDPLAPLRVAVEQLYLSQKTAEKKAQALIAHVHRSQKESIKNLVHYLAIRRHDLRSLQDDLHNAGLSSFASAEGHILRQVQAVLLRLGAVLPIKDLSKIDFNVGTQLIKQRAFSLFGAKQDSKIPHLMVTFETGMAQNYGAVKALLKAGMNIARINSAHDGEKEWKQMIDNVHRASLATGQPCKIYLDLAGPKIRTILYGKGRKKGRLKMKENDSFFLVESAASVNRKEKVIGCTLAGIVKDLRVGDRVLFDDGLFEAVVEVAGDQRAKLKMLRVSTPKPNLKPEKGINFPDTALTVRSLTDYDKSIIPFAQEHADLLGFSFVRSAADVAELQSMLKNRPGKKIPIILKIETFEAVQNLPDLLVQGMVEPAFGVMIARGDLAVEIGFERLSEIQEEILWLCEAAHVPVIWATQVLETLNKSGIATRSEVTDATQAAQAECVMLNKGKYLLAVLATLQDILQRSGGHHVKKRYVFRPLRIAERFLADI